MGTDGLVRRWVAFNGVGAVGIGVQLGLLAALVRAAGMHYLPATAIAVETAVLHNFVWHERWTWRDRPSGSRAGLFARLLRFHLLNGLVSLVGNLMLMRVLAGMLGMDPIAANIVAIVACSLVNFAASEMLVFRTTAPLVLAALLPATLSADGRPAASSLDAAELRPATLSAWKAYEQRVDARYHALGPGSTTYFALDGFRIAGWRDTAGGGSIAMHRIDRADPVAGDIEVPDGKVHHWAGAVFVPGLTIDRLLSHLAERAGRESQEYEDVVASKLLSRDGDRHRVFLKLRRTNIITVTYNTEHAIEYRRFGPTRAAARSVATKIAELADAGTPTEREKPVGSDHGFLWRLNAYWRYEAVNGGVLIQCESVSLSRSVPFVLKPFVMGTVERIARESLQKTLTGLRRALTNP
jgi:putative flippase GtrA